ncbi:hypothetical protein A2Z00_03620 [Candidatus Gottesmanbacteria bacterium RBG_13_45_10]|uniref:Peptidase C39 domain-containing protein n=1 Tax=Candidatus Gottesmanbacteria bacterium RBG_13_45_10 TaxID=1798370 RepID=A0A1F5ZHX6_9BACT|nr:MAG: hypothetical protein A2Z00_03620 [Candidatus Gottesmanbacteria bacterium RBG_13_45_10]
MLLGNLNIDVTQQTITSATGISKSDFNKNGIYINHMVRALQILTLDAMLWYKAHATIEDIRVLLDTYGYPVGVEWQGLFSDDEEIDDDTGHYSIVTCVDDERKALIIVDPYKDFATQDRIIGIQTFLKRWWDDNELKDRVSGKKRMIRDEQLLFIITHASASFPSLLGMMPGSSYNS